MDLNVIIKDQCCVDATGITQVNLEEVKIKEEILEQSNVLCEDTSISYAAKESPVHPNVTVASSIVTDDQHKTTYFKTDGQKMNYNEYFKQKKTTNQSEFQILNVYSMDEMCSQNKLEPTSGVNLIHETIPLSSGSIVKMENEEHARTFNQPTELNNPQNIKQEQSAMLSTSLSSKRSKNSSDAYINELSVKRENEANSSLPVLNTDCSLVYPVVYLKKDQCSICKSQFATNHSLTHICRIAANKRMGRDESDAGDKLFTCAQCSYRCSYRCYLSRHMRTHTGEKPFACTLCSYRCSSNSNLSIHMRTHTGKKPFSCTICSYRCIQSGNLSRHMRRHTGEKPFSCTICSYRCIQSSNLSKHMRRHTGEKSFSCTICFYRCSNSSRLSLHMHTHTDEKPFACTECSYRCSDSSSLSRHMGTHTGEKRFACTECSFRCSHSSSLSKHMLRHSGYKPFACPLCSYTCSVSSSLTRHIQRHAL